jgi:hypothetical protein
MYLEILHEEVPFNKTQVHSFLFEVIILLTNVLHMKCMDLTYKVIGDHDLDPTTHGSHQDF